MSKQRLNNSKFLLFLVCLVFAFSSVYCGGGGGGSPKKNNQVTLPSKIMGEVSDDGTETKNISYLTKAPGTCSGSSFEEYIIGGSGESVYTGTAEADGSFECDAPETDEVVLEFACGMKCFGKPGTTDLVCDPISNAIVAALEAAVGDVTSSELYQGLSIATIAAGMVETLKLISRLDPTNDIVALIDAIDLGSPTAADDILAIVQASPVGALFSTLETIAEEQYAYNESIQDESGCDGDVDCATEMAADASWTVENVINLITGLGISVNVSVDDGTGNGPGSLYSDMMTNIDSWVYTDETKGVVYNLKPYLLSLYDKLYGATPESSQVAMYCYARKESYDGPQTILKYPPSLNTTPNPDQLTCLDAATTDPLGITTGGSLNGEWRVNLMIAPSFSEPDRNDVTGEHANDKEFNDFNVEVINVYQEFMDAMMPDTGACGDFMVAAPVITNVNTTDGTLTMQKKRPYYTDMEIQISSSGTLPTGFAPNTTYYASPVAGENDELYQVRLKDGPAPGGTVIVPTDIGTGTHNLVMDMDNENDAMWFDNDITDGDLTFASCVKANNFDRYFSGLAGIYNFLRNPALRNGKFALEGDPLNPRDGLYDAFAGADYMGMRVDADMWQLGLDNRGVQVNYEDPNDTYHTSAWMFEDISDTAGHPAFKAVCPEGAGYPVELCSGGMPINTDPCTMGTYLDPPTNSIPCLEDGDSDPAKGQWNIINSTETDIRDLIEMMKPSYDTTMAMFENIPTMEQIKQSIFGDAHHVPYNIKGSSTFHVKGGKGTQNQYESNMPILCKIVRIADNAIVPAFAEGGTEIICEQATTGTWTDGMPDTNAKNAYLKYYALSERSWSEDGMDEFFTLLNFSNGQEYRLNGREFRIRAVMFGYTPVPAPVIDGRTVQSINRDICNTWQDASGNMQTHCWTEMFDYVAVSFDSAWYPTSSYNPYTWNMPFMDSNGNQYNMQIAIHDNETSGQSEQADDRSVCLKGAAVIVDINNDQRVIAQIALNNGGGTSYLIDCFNNSEQTFYYLQPQWGMPDRVSSRYRIQRNDGMYVWPDGFTNASSETFTVDIGSNTLIVADASVYEDNQEIKLSVSIGNLPSPLWQGQSYWVIPVSDIEDPSNTRIRLKWGWDQPAIDLTTTGGGTFTIYRDMLFYTEVFLTDVEAELQTLSVCGPDSDELCDTATLGPIIPETRLNSTEIANLGHETKYDPYCDDTTDGTGTGPSDGRCGCGTWNEAKTVFTREADPSNCTLDNAADPVEPTLSNLPYCEQCSNDPNTEKVKAVLKYFGGMQGAPLATALLNVKSDNNGPDDIAGNADDNLDISTVGADWQKMFVCANGEDLRWIDTGALASGNPNAGDGCGTVAFTANSGTDILTVGQQFGAGMPVTLAVGSLPAPLVAGTTYYTRETTPVSLKLSLTNGGPAIDITADGSGTINIGMGPVRLMKILRRNNAYNIGRPNTLLKLISSATSTCGTGVEIDPAEQIFNFQEALSLMFLRLSMPADAEIRDSGNIPIGGVSIYFRNENVPGSHNDPVSGLMRAFLEQADYIEPYTP